MRLLWSHPLPAVPLGLSLAREVGSLLVWDAERHLGRYNSSGQSELRQRAPSSFLSAAFSDDGHTIAAIGKRGQVWLMTGDLVPVWERSLPRRPLALALDHLGQRVAVADESGELHVFDPSGKLLWHATSPRPLVHLAFIPEVAVLVGSAEFGLVCAFDRGGQCAWRDGLVARVGSLAVSGDGSRILLACFTDGFCVYAHPSPKQNRLPRAAPARLAVTSYAGDVVAAIGLETDLSLRGADGEIRASLALPAAPIGLAMEPLGGSLVAALSNGTLARVDLTS